MPGEVNPALVSLIALIAAIGVSCFSRVNAGLVSMVFALAIGTSLGGLKMADVLAGFPASLFLTLAAVTLLFSQARVNGTLDRAAVKLTGLARGNPGMIPLIVFLLALALSTIGAGNIAATALLAPVAMAVAGEAGISAFLMAMMLANGASAGAFSPFAPTGIIANGLMARAGIAGAEWRNFFNTLTAQSMVALGGYFLLGGLKLFERRSVEAPSAKSEPLNSRQRLTLAVTAGFVVSIVVFRADLILAAFSASVALSLFRAADEEAAIRAMPWNTILMVCGVTMLIAVMEKTGGMDLFTSLLARFSSKESITAVIAFVTGAISVYSSSSGVVLPAFLPTVPSLIQKLGGGDALAIASSINVGAHLVDVSPLSTLGALCIASAAKAGDRDRLFNQMLVWGLSMTVVGALVCYVCFGLL